MISKRELLRRVLEISACEMDAVVIAELIAVFSTSEMKGHKIYLTPAEAEASFMQTHPTGLIILDDIITTTEKEILGYYIRKVN